MQGRDGRLRRIKVRAQVVYLTQPDPFAAGNIEVFPRPDLQGNEIEKGFDQRDMDLVARGIAAVGVDGRYQPDDAVLGVQHGEPLSPSTIVPLGPLITATLPASPRFDRP